MLYHARVLVNFESKNSTPETYMKRAQLGKAMFERQARQKEIKVRLKSTMQSNLLLGRDVGIEPVVRFGIESRVQSG